MERRYFGTDGVRGLYGGPVVNEAFFMKIGEAAARWLESGGVRSGKVLIGRDTRASGASLAAALGEGFARGGTLPIGLGILPTPAVSGAVRSRGAALGAVVTASHNPATDNGVKFFGPDGTKLSDAEEAAIESLLDASGAGRAGASAGPEEPPTGSVLDAYIATASRILPAGSLRGWTIALDTANGATCASSPSVLKGLGAEVSCIGGNPNGLNINAGVGSEHPEALVELVRKTHARLGIAHDGDGDRCVLCDELGGILDGDELLVILAAHALERGTLAKKTLVVTVQSNLAVDFAVADAGGRVIRTAVGDRYVTERMRAEGAALGGESSGHIVCFDVGPTGDGLAAALKVLGVMLETGRPLSELRKILIKFPQLSAGLKVREKKPLSSLPALSETILDLERELGARGRVLVRYSGTEPKLRLLVEGPTQAIVSAGIARLRAAASADLEVL
jgi:phosphoglucosamine mutase